MRMVNNLNPFCDRIIANQHTRDHSDGDTSPDLAPNLDYAL